jgi:hypothetical protein
LGSTNRYNTARSNAIPAAARIPTAIGDRRLPGSAASVAEYGVFPNGVEYDCG